MLKISEEDWRSIDMTCGELRAITTLRRNTGIGLVHATRLVKQLQKGEARMEDFFTKISPCPHCEGTGVAPQRGDETPNFKNKSTQEVVKAIHYFGYDSNPSEGVCRCDSEEDRLSHIHTPEGYVLVASGDWVVTNAKGERHPCSPTAFRETYTAI